MSNRADHESTAQKADEPVDLDYPVTPVPRSARKPFFSLAIVLLGFTIFTPTMLAHALLGIARVRAHTADLLVNLLLVKLGFEPVAWLADV